MTARKSRRATHALIAAAVVATVGAGALLTAAVTEVTSSGPQPWQAMPAGTAAFVAVDADPSLSQKIEAVKLADVFAGGRGADPAQSATTALLGDIPASSVLPWSGPRSAVAVADHAGSVTHPVTFHVVAVEDPARMKTTLGALRAKRTPAAFGFAPVGHDWVLMSESQQAADALAAGAARTALDADSGLKADLATVPKARVATGWADLSKLDAVTSAALEDSPLRRLGAVPGVGSGDVTGRLVASAVLNSGAVQLDAHARGWKVAGRPAMPTRAATGDLASTLPANAAAAVGLARPADYANAWFAGLPQTEQQRWKGQAGTMGIRVPEDFTTALGTEASAALLTDKPAGGVVVKTRTDDPFNGFHAVQSFTQQWLFPNTGTLWASALDGQDIITGTSPAVVAAAKGAGGLGASKEYQRAVPAQGPAAFVGYANLPALLAASTSVPTVPGLATLTEAGKEKAGQLGTLGVWLGPSTDAGDVNASVRLRLR